MNNIYARINSKAMVNLALVGTGKWGINYFKTIEKMKNCEITHLISQTIQSLSQFSDKYHKSTNYLDLLTSTTIDGIIIATPGSTHYEIVKDLLPKYPLLVEKPLTLNLKESLQIIKLNKKTKSLLMVGHIYLHNPAFQKTKELLPTIGKLQYVSFTGYNYGPFRDDMSALWEWTPHGISMFLNLMNDLPVEVSAWSIAVLRPKRDLYDNIYVKLTFNNSVVCVLNCGWLYPFKRRELIVYGSKQTIVFDDLAERKISLYEGLGPTVTGGKVIEKQPTIQYPQYNSLSPLKVEINAFIELIKHNKQPVTNINQAVNVISVISAAEKSLQKNGKAVKI